eukprot:m.14454 g.14454  ORF g.14454 m.14454 type:complete len:465 (+) comp4801_c0_seq1:245-1639(+)
MASLKILPVTVPSGGDVGEARKQTVLDEISLLAEEDCFDSEPFVVTDIGDIHRKHDKWQKLLPRVEPFYAIKCNNDPLIVKALVALGLSFDCASKGEIEQAVLAGARGDQIVFAHPCKPVSHIKFAKQHNVKLMTFDRAEELLKVKTHFPDAELLLRILPDDSRSLCKLGNKFGARLSHVATLMAEAKKLGLHVAGISFHVGSGCLDAAAYRDAVELARRAWDIGLDAGFGMHVLDVGGGFPGGVARISFEESARVLNSALDELFPASSGVRIIAEPGRYFVASACSLVCNVIAKAVVQRDDPDEEPSDVPHHMVYINDGVYGSFNCIERDHAVVSGFPLNPVSESALVDCTVWGPTCDGIDLVLEKVRLPNFEIGSWMVFHDMGAYASSAGSTFNGFPQPNPVYIYTLECHETDDQPANSKIIDLSSSELWQKISPPGSPSPCKTVTMPLGGVALAPVPVAAI